jgi:glycosyltransferase involved in cell wall biosynthesis
LTAALTDSSPVSLIDAMAMGLIPVIADTPGVKEWLEGSHALTFSQNNSNELVSVINQILENKILPEIRGQNLLHVKQKALFEKYVAARINLLKRLAGQL